MAESQLKAHRCTRGRPAGCGANLFPADASMHASLALLRHRRRHRHMHLVSQPTCQMRSKKWIHGNHRVRKMNAKRRTIVKSRMRRENEQTISTNYTKPLNTRYHMREETMRRGDVDETITLTNAPQSVAQHWDCHTALQTPTLFCRPAFCGRSHT